MATERMIPSRTATRCASVGSSRCLPDSVGPGAFFSDFSPSALAHLFLGNVNDIIRHAAQCGQELGEAVGRTIEEEAFPHRDLSVAAACWRKGVPLTCHVTIGADIIHAHPNCDGAALG
jgi:hypothetical protein